MPETSAERYRDLHLPNHEAEQERACAGRADADIAPTRERYFPLHRPLPGNLDEDEPIDQAHEASDRFEEAPPAPQEAPQSLPTSALARKELPLTTGLLDYFPAALIAVAGLSRIGNEQHNPGQPILGAREERRRGRRPAAASRGPWDHRHGRRAPLDQGGLEGAGAAPERAGGGRARAPVARLSLKSSRSGTFGR